MPTGQVSRLMPTLRRVVLAGRSAARSDGELLGAFVADRDSDAFAELVRRHGPMVLGVCRRVIGDRTTADDAFQASFVVLARRAASVRPREQVGNFLYGVAYRTALKARMVLARRRSREKQVETMPEPTAPAARTDWTDLLPVIDEELAKLPDKLRLPVVLCDLEGRPQREVAKHLDVPPATLATRLASARRTLAARLTRRGVALSGGALAGLLGAHAAALAVPPALAAGVVRAGEAVAAGAAVHSLVSANAVQLSEGVLRMMMLAKLKAVAVLAVTALVLSTGFGVGLVPATADDAPAGAPADKPAPAGAATAAKLKERAAADPNADDATFLRRLCMDVRGTPPTEVELWFFVSDPDADKRAKVADWIADDAVVLVDVTKLGADAEEVTVVRGHPADRRLVELQVEEAAEKVARAARGAVAKDDKVIVEVKLADAEARAKQAEAKLAQAREALTADRMRLQRAVQLQAERAAAQSGAVAALQKVIAAQDKAKAEKDAKGAEGKRHRVVTVTGEPAEAGALLGDVFKFVGVTAEADSDAEFLKRVLTDARGTGPTALEVKYFTEDKDPKKRERLLDELLKEPAVQKKLGAAWKAKMLAAKSVTITTEVKEVKGDKIIVVSPDGKTKEGPIVVRPLPPQKDVPAPPKPPAPPVPPAPPAPPVVKPIVKPIVVPGQPLAPLVEKSDKVEKLVAELIAAKKSDEAVLEALTLATLGRLPTDSEKRLTLAGLSNAADRKAAWVAVARALAGADGGSAPKVKVVVEPKPPVPPAKP